VNHLAQSRNLLFCGHRRPLRGQSPQVNSFDDNRKPTILRCTPVRYNATFMAKNMPKHSAARGHAPKSFPLKKNFCFVCGHDNPEGMRFKFAQEGKHFVCRFRLGKRYTGPPGYCHGGIIATILDDAMSKLNKLRSVVAPTARMTVEYLKPVPLYKPLRVESHEFSKRGRRLTHVAKIFDEQGRVLARSQGPLHRD
jgi:uncharacterized protein (TIGR00369 family)